MKFTKRDLLLVLSGMVIALAVIVPAKLPDNSKGIHLVVNSILTGNQNLMANFTTKDFKETEFDSSGGENCKIVAELLNQKWPQNNYRCELK